MGKLKDNLKKQHGNNLKDCNFGIKTFHTKKRTLEPAEAARANQPSTKGKKPTSTTTTTTAPPDPPQGGVILLDFTGHTVTGTAWNFSGPIVCAPSNLTAEQVDDIISNVAVEFDPFDVVVTIDEALFLSFPAGQRIRVILTETWEWYGQAGGVAFIDSFAWTDDTPAFVFTSLLGYNTKNIKEATTHEIGHTMGLQHQSVYNENCVKTSEYRNGAIMGTGYYVPDAESNWIVGTSSIGCNSIQDDVAVLTSVLGAA